MQRVALIYNPVSGRHPRKRAAQIAQVMTVFQEAGIAVKAFPTESPNSASLQAQHAALEGHDTILACGGDGTVHEVLQNLVGGSVALGVIPMGTANALANDLGLPASPVKAAKMLLTAAPVRVSVGRVFYVDSEANSRSRYFIVAAGIGADALLMSRLDPQLKQRFGYALYGLEALRLWATHRYPMFAACFQERGSQTPRVENVSQILAVRIGNFGGVLRHLVPGAAIFNSNLHVVAVKTRSRLRYLRFMIAVLLRRHTFADPIELVDCESMECFTLEGSTERLFVEADGEWLGTLPVRIEVVPQALTLLVPQKIPGRGQVSGQAR
ncbi:MAG: diacylglycerol/lipid kinase family protein [Acidobacteriaceae bacterium]